MNNTTTATPAMSALEFDCKVLQIGRNGQTEAEAAEMIDELELAGRLSEPQVEKMMDTIIERF